MIVWWITRRFRSKSRNFAELGSNMVTEIQFRHIFEQNFLMSSMILGSLILLCIEDLARPFSGTLVSTLLKAL